MEKIAVLIPCYNEEKTIRKVVSDFRQSLPEAVVYVYDNNSTDRSAELALAAGAVVRHEAMQGKGNVIRRMFREIDAECYIMADGDDTYPPQYAKEMAELVLKKNADMVVGDRLSSTYYSVNRRPFHNFGNSLVKKSVNLLFHSDLQDLMTGYRAFSYDFVKTFPVLSSGFEIETEMSIHAVDKKMQIGHVVIDYRDRPKGSASKLDTFSDGFRILWMIVKLYSTYRPLGFFELIVCDDASTDSSLNILLRYRKKDPRIIVIRNRRNLGLGASLNRCLERARGRYIARQDADDISSSDRLEKILHYLKANSLPFAACGVFIFDDKGVWSRRLYPEIIKKHDIARHNPFFHPTMIFRREVLEAAGGYRVAPETRRAEDYDLVMRLASLGFIGQNLQEYLYYVYEPADAYLRHTLKTRLIEIRLRWHGYRTMRLPLRDYVFLAKPVFMMVVPHSVLRRFKELQWGR